MNREFSPEFHRFSLSAAHLRRARGAAINPAKPKNGSPNIVGPPSTVITIKSRQQELRATRKR